MGTRGYVGHTITEFISLDIISFKYVHSRFTPLSFARRQYPGNPPLWGEMYTIKRGVNGGKWRIRRRAKGATPEEKSGGSTLGYDDLLMKHAMISRACRRVESDAEVDLAEIMYKRRHVDAGRGSRHVDAGRGSESESRSESGSGRDRVIDEYCGSYCDSEGLTRDRARRKEEL